MEPERNVKLISSLGCSAGSGTYPCPFSPPNVKSKPVVPQRHAVQNSGKESGKRHPLPDKQVETASDVGGFHVVCFVITVAQLSLGTRINKATATRTVESRVVSYPVCAAVA